MKSLLLLFVHNLFTHSITVDRLVQRHAYGAGQRQIYRGNPVQIDDLPVGYPDKPHLVQLLLQLVEPQAVTVDRLSAKNDRLSKTYGQGVREKVY